MGIDHHKDQPRDWHGRYASSPRTRQSGPPSGSEELHNEAGVRVLLTGGRTPTYQIWRGEELLHEQPATRNWRQERKDMVIRAAQIAGTAGEQATALPKRPAGREVFSAGEVTAIVTEGNEPKFQVYKGDTLVHEQPATRAWRAEQQEVVRIAQEQAGIVPTAAQQINANLRAGTVRRGEVTLRDQLDYAYLYVENQLAINPAADRRKLEQKGRELAAKWAAQGPSRFAREHQFQVSREYQRILEEEDVDRNKDIYE